MPRQDVSVELYYDGAWHDLVVGDDVLARTPLKITRGQGEESQAPRPAEIIATLANDDDLYRTSNPESPLYGKAGRNTPIRVSVGGVVRGTAEVSAWEAGQTRDFRRTPRRGSAWVDIEAGGLLQRVNQWSEPEQSAMRQWMSTYANSRGYWTGEDGQGATQLANAYPGGAPGHATSGVTFRGAAGPGGSDELVSVTSSARMGGSFASMSTTAGWQFAFVLDLSEVTLTAAESPIISWRTSQGYTWSWCASTSTYRLLIVDDDGATVLNSATLYGEGAEPDQWITTRFKVSASGGTVTVEIGWYPENAEVLYGNSPTFAGTVGRLTSWLMSTPTLDNVHVGHVIGLTGVSDNLQAPDFIDAFNGYRGETAGARFDRFCRSKNLAYSIIGDSALSMPMGPQGVASFAENMREIVTTEDGLLFDAIDDVELVLMLRNARYSQAASVQMLCAELPELPAEVTDDLGVHNIVTVSQRNGGDATVADESGPLGTQAPPDGVGEYRQTVDVNIADEADLPAVAGWWLNRGTVDLPRYPVVTVNLTALPASRVEEIEAVDVGSVIEILDYREYVIRMYVLGYTETITQTRRMISFTCAPDRQFDVGTYDDGVSQLDSASTTVKTALSITDAVVTFRTQNSGDVWSTSATPYDVIIAGQRSRVTSMGAAALVSGAYDQTATLARGTDGIRKAIAAGEPIHAANPGRWAL